MQKLEFIKAKILCGEELERKLAYWRFKNLKIVFSNGCFDILHAGHVDYLSKAADEGDVLIIGLNTDASTKRLKGPTRPINDQDARAMIMASLSFVTAVVLFDEDTPYNLIKQVQPDVLVKGSDYKPEDIVGYDILKAKGGEVKTLDLLPGYSTTSIEQNIFNNFKGK
ncbi:MAG: D-glycero-beta-D-manno-heptose 1-phosphate adenylyltransferase [Bacteroidota bacterium]